MSNSNIREKLRSSQKSALKFFGFGDDALALRTRSDRVSSVGTKKEDYFSDYKGLKQPTDANDIAWAKKMAEKTSV